MKKYIFPTIAGYLAAASFAGLILVPLYFNPSTAALHEIAPESYYAEPVLWAGFLAGFLQTFLTVILYINMGYRTVLQGALNGVWLGALLGGIQSLNEASQYVAFNANGQAFTNILVFCAITSISGAAIAWTLNWLDKKEA
tara:strand:+ start:117 stop:539 length:423 start_codon:yes stop_codon:yes gene_type:complete